MERSTEGLISSRAFGDSLLFYKISMPLIASLLRAIIAFWLAL